MATVLAMTQAQVVPKKSLHELLLLADVPAGLTWWNIPRNYPGHTSINWFEVSVWVKYQPQSTDIYLSLGYVLLPMPHWNAFEVYENLCGAYPDVPWCVTQM